MLMSMMETKGHRIFVIRGLLRVTLIFRENESTR